MANIKELKKKIRSTHSSLKVTAAMKLVSAAKLARAQADIINARPYAEELDRTIVAISSQAQKYHHPYLVDHGHDKEVLLVLSSDKGLCGGYNVQLLKKVLANQKTETLFMGKKVREGLCRVADVGPLLSFGISGATYQDVEKVAHDLGDRFCRKEIGKVWVAYNKFRSAMSFVPTVRPLLPMARQKQERGPVGFSDRYDPSDRAILDIVVPEAYVVGLWTCVLEARASEHGSRMVAMDNASSNCQEMIESLTLAMNKARQAAITTELIEVVSGAESLKSS